MRAASMAAPSCTVSSSLLAEERTARPYGSTASASAPHCAGQVAQKRSVAAVGDCGLSSLPEDVFLHIAVGLPLPDCLCLQRTSKRFAAFLEEPRAEGRLLDFIRKVGWQERWQLYLKRVEAFDAKAAVGVPVPSKQRRRSALSFLQFESLRLERERLSLYWQGRRAQFREALRGCCRVWVPLPLLTMLLLHILPAALMSPTILSASGVSFCFVVLVFMALPDLDEDLLIPRYWKPPYSILDDADLWLAYLAGAAMWYVERSKLVVDASPFEVSRSQYDFVAGVLAVILLAVRFDWFQELAGLFCIAVFLCFFVYWFSWPFVHGHAIATLSISICFCCLFCAEADDDGF
eukprot:TRINITY_DN20245_c0_g1_i1.p1 TRINITY_DN20245_c0_g1~~TRINITY_DN20245_c0_g1_i1.p1  ORF type:complete len:390 (-),score=55.86 TRINITY_DN20245_c0_g1_i1:8-1054(-)